MNIEELFNTPFLAPYKRLFRIFTKWEEVVGKYVDRSAPLFIDRKKLVMRADDEFTMTELHFVKEEIKEKVNTLLGEKIVEEIKIVCRKAKRKKKRTMKKPPSVVIPAEIKQIIDEVNDPVMKEKMERFCLSILGLRIKKEVE